MQAVTQNKATQLFIILGGFFIANAIIAEFIGVKIFSLEDSLGIERFNLNLFGHTRSLELSAGVLLWPIVFVMTDVINEYFGKKGVRLLSYLTVGLIGYAFVILYAAIGLTPTEWWPTSYEGVPDMQNAFEATFGQGLWIIIGSIAAFLIGQLLDVIIFHRIKKITGEKMIWLRATGSTLISQLVDSFIVLYIAFVLGPPKWPMDLFLAVGLTNYTYKFVMAIGLTPVIYIAHYLIDSYLGKVKAEEMKRLAAI